jgi:hypothetical protein
MLVGVLEPPPSTREIKHMSKPLENTDSLPRPATVGIALYRLALLALLGSIAFSLRDMASGVHVKGRHDFDAIDVNVRGGLNASVGGWVEVKEKK